MGRSTRRTCTFIALMAGILSTAGTCPPRQPEPSNGEILLLDASPSPVCVNIGLPIVRIGFRARSSDQQCVRIAINGEALVSPFRSPEPGIVGQNRCGEGEWAETYTFSLSTFFGNNIPPTVEITAELDDGGAVTAPITILDSARTAITTTTCTPGVTPGQQYHSAKFSR